VTSEGRREQANGRTVWGRAHFLTGRGAGWAADHANNDRDGELFRQVLGLAARIGRSRQPPLQLTPRRVSSRMPQSPSTLASDHVRQDGRAAIVWLRRGQGRLWRRNCTEGSGSVSTSLDLRSQDVRQRPLVEAGDAWSGSWWLTAATGHPCRGHIGPAQSDGSLANAGRCDDGEMGAGRLGNTGCHERQRLAHRHQSTDLPFPSASSIAQQG
jgi:hypothetical protein